MSHSDSTFTVTDVTAGAYPERRACLPWAIIARPHEKQADHCHPDDSPSPSRRVGTGRGRIIVRWFDTTKGKSGSGVRYAKGLLGIRNPQSTFGLAGVLLFFIRLYRLIFSPAQVYLFGAGSGCRFTPTCSQYAAEAIRRHGALAGSVLALKRICRCHPLGMCGHDPVPEAKAGK